MKKKMNVFCVDLGYSLKRDLQIWNNDNCSYAGHILYGVNHMEENGIHPIFEFGQHGMIYGKWYMFLDEIVKFFSLFHKRNRCYLDSACLLFQVDYYIA